MAKTAEKEPQVTHAPRSQEPMEFAQLFGEHLRAGYQCMFVPTSEEARLEAEIGKAANQMNMNVITWGCDEGFNNPESVRGNDKFRAPYNALKAIAGEGSPFQGNNVFVMRDLDDFFNDPTVRRHIRSLCEGNKLVNRRYKRPIVIASPLRKIHDRLKSCITMVDFALPGEERLRQTLKFVCGSIESDDKSKSDIDDELADQIVQCLRGLTSNEAENALARCLVRHGGFTPDMLSTIKDEKAGIIRKSEVLTYIPEDHQARREEIGGYQELMNWVDRRRLAYGRKAKDQNIDYPKGVVLIGVPGTGKSYVAAAVARLLGLPGYIMDIGSVFGSLVGESEQRMRDALRQVEAQQGCVLLLDEADKAFGGAVDSQGDSGVTRRVFGQLLTWLASKEDRTFVIMTLNRTQGIPPEFLRAGRFDAVFWTDLPNEEERRQIIEIHLRKRLVDPTGMDLSTKDWDAIVQATENYVGSELEQLVKEARYISFEKREVGTPNFDELMEAKASIIPIAQLEEEKVNDIREWCKNRAKNVSSPPKRKRQPRARAIDLGNN